MLERLGLGCLALVCVAACGGSGSGGGGFKDGGTDGSVGGVGNSGGSGGVGNSGGSGGVGNSGGSGGVGNGGGSGATGGVAGAAGGGGTGGASSAAIPATCAEAASAGSHFGCEFWPTVTPNPAWSIFDFAVIVVNPGTASADVTVKRGTTTITEKINGKSTKTIYLPWVSSLKGADADVCGSVVASGGSVRETGGAYRLTSTIPVAVFQHSPIEYKPTGGPTGKSWAGCPGDQVCTLYGFAVGCFSNANDSSLLLPTTSLGKVYRAVGFGGWPLANVGPYLVVTGTQNTTKLTVTVSLAGSIKAGGGIADKAAGEVFDVFFDQGDVIVLQAPPTATLAGTLLSADKPIQVVSGMSCAQIPVGQQACDHLEETLFPAPALGKRYLVQLPQGPKADEPGHYVHFVGHSDGTTLTYPAGTPPGAPASLAAGQLVDLGLVNQSFEVQGNQAFSVVSFIPSADTLDPTTQPPDQIGDPSMRVLVPVEQFRTAYSVSLPPNYVSSHIEAILPTAAKLMLDGSLVSQTPVAIGTSGYGVVRIPADSPAEVFHLLEADQPFGLQVVGYGKYASYAHPGGGSVKTLP